MVKDKRFWLVILGIFLAVANITWLVMDTTPPAWDQAAHVRSVVMWSQYYSGEKNLLETIRSNGGYPPLVYAVTGIFTKLGWLGVDQISLWGTVFLVISVGGVYVLGGIYSAIFFSLIPIITDYSRTFTLDMPIMAMVIWGYYFWRKSGDFQKQKWNMAWWVMLVLASLTKLNGFLYFVPMVIYSLLIILKQKKYQRMGTLILLGVGWLMAVGWWWVVNWANIKDYVLGLAGQGEPLTDPQNLLSLATWFHYTRLLVLHQFTPILTLIWLGVVIIALRKKTGLRRLIFYWLLVYLIFTVLKNKEYRFTMPALFVLAIWFGKGIERLKNLSLKPVWVILCLLIFSYEIFFWWENSFSYPIKKPMSWNINLPGLGETDLLGLTNYPLRSYHQDYWPQVTILGDLVKQKSELKQDFVHTLVLINLEEVNDNNLGIYKELYGAKGVEFGSVGSRAEFKSEEEILALVSNFDFILVPELNMEPAPYFGINIKAYKQAIVWVWSNEKMWTKVGEYEAWGRKLTLFATRK